MAVKTLKMRILISLVSALLPATVFAQSFTGERHVTDAVTDGARPCYIVGADVEVTLSLTFDVPGGNVGVWGISERIPAGWAFVSANNNGEYDAPGKRVSGTATGNPPPEVSYILTPTSVGDTTFSTIEMGLFAGMLITGTMDDTILPECADDDVAPESSVITSGIHGPQTWSGVIHGTASDDTSGVASVIVTIQRLSDGRSWNGELWTVGFFSRPVSRGTTTWEYDLPLAALEEAGSGVGYVVVSRATDAVGNVQNEPGSNTFSFDSAPPTGVYFIGSGDPTYTTLLNVTLDVVVAGATEMRFRNVSGMFPESWTSIAGTFDFPLDGGDGTTTVFAEFRDAALNVLELSDDIIVDTTPPMSAVSTSGVFGPATWPGSIAGSASDNVSGVSNVHLRLHRSDDDMYWNGAAWGSDSTTFISASGDTTWSSIIPVAALSDGHSYAVDSRALDAAGNAESNLGNGFFQFDASAPVGSFSIGMGDPPFVISPNVTLAVAVSGATEMRFRNASGIFPESWSSVAAPFGFALDGGDGMKTVFAEFRDTARNVLALTDDVVLDATDPISTVLTAGTVGPNTWSGPIATVGGTASDSTSGVDQVTVTIQRLADGRSWDGDTWQFGFFPLGVSRGTTEWEYDLPFTALAEAGNGVGYVVVSRATDVAGNEQSEPGSNSFTFDSEPPTGLFTIGTGDPSYTTSPEVTLGVAVTGATEMRFRNASGNFPEAWTSVAGTLDFALAQGDGTKTVFAQFRDAALNVLAVSDSIVLDATMPVSAVSTSGAFGPSTWPDSIVTTASDNLSGISAVHIRLQRSSDDRYWNGSEWGDESETFLAASGDGVWSLSVSAGALTNGVNYGVNSRATDLAGNIEADFGSSTFQYDASPPAGAFFIVDDMTVYTNTPTVVLNNRITGADEMRIRNAGAAFPNVWLIFDSAPVWLLDTTADDGAQMVEIEFRDFAGNVLHLSDTIILDRVDPDTSLQPPDVFGPLTWPGEITGSATEQTSGVAAVDVRLRNDDDGTFWNGASWQQNEIWIAATADLPAWSLSVSSAALTHDTTYSVSARANDAAGNVDNTPATSSFSYDAVAPDIAVVEVLINVPFDSGSVDIAAGVAATDAHLGVISTPDVHVSPDAIDSTIIGETRISYSAADAAGNTSNAFRDYRVGFQISGNITYDKATASTPLIDVTSHGQETDSIDASVAGNGPWTFTLFIVGESGTYDLAAVLDTSADGEPDAEEPGDRYANRNVTITDNLADINFHVAEWEDLVSYDAGWNFVAFPGQPFFSAPHQLIAGARPELWEIDNSNSGYRPASEFSALSGQWVYLDVPARNVLVRGNYLPDSTQTIPAGWRAIGVRNSLVKPNLLGPVWEWRANRYLLVPPGSTLQRYCGYVVFAAATVIFVY